MKSRSAARFQGEGVGRTKRLSTIRVGVGSLSGSVSELDVLGSALDEVGEVGKRSYVAGISTTVSGYSEF